MLKTKIYKTDFKEELYRDKYLKENRVDETIPDGLRPEDHDRAKQSIEASKQELAFKADEYAMAQVKKALKGYSETAAWCNVNEAMIEDKGDYYEVVEMPEVIMTNDVVNFLRAAHYAEEVDPLVAEYRRKEITGAFEAGKAEALKAEIEAAVQKIKDDLPYLAESETTDD